MGLWAHRGALNQPAEWWESRRGFLEEGLPEGWRGQPGRGGGVFQR